MSLMLTRIFSLTTLISYLVLGTVAVRFFTPETTQLTFTSEYLAAFNTTQISTEILVTIEAPEITFSDIKIPVEKKIIAKAKVVKPLLKVSQPQVENTLKDVLVAKNELPFLETVKINAVKMIAELETNNIAYFKSAPVDTSMMVATVEDRVSTTQAVGEEEEPEFFEYPIEEKNEVAAEKPAVVEEKIVSEVVQDNTDEEISISDIATPVATPQTHDTSEIAMDEELVAFDYSKASRDIQASTAPSPSNGIIHSNVGATASTTSTIIPTVAAATTHQSKPSREQSPGGVITQTGAESYKSDNFVPENEEIKPEPIKDPTYPIEVTIQATGTNLKNFEKLNNFKLRFQDDSSEVGDIGSGDVVIKEQLSSPKATRSVLLMKPGFIPTSTDLILSEDFYDLSVPMIEEETFNTEIQSFEGSGPVGAVLVELDDETELAQLDVPFGKVVLLDGDMKITDREDFRFQLFMGVRAGNALLTYKAANNSQIQKIIHVHDREVTFDSNFFEDVVSKNVKLFEEDLMAREKSPLITGAGDIRIFATQKIATKVANNIYKLDFERGHLGGRRYLELNHQGDSIFAGFRGAPSITMPSENLRKYVESYKNAGSCLIQVNLKKKVLNVDIGTESVEASLMTSVQMLDSDGKFYDSVSEKTRKVIIVGEGQGANGVSRDGKINVKVDYVDGSFDYLNTFCSPDTYLVEQL